MVAHAQNIDRHVGPDGLTAGLQRAWGIAVGELEAIERGFFEHDYPGKLLMLLLTTIAATLSFVSLSILAGAVMRADHPVFTALIGAALAVPACGLWRFLREFARFHREARLMALLLVGELLLFGVIMWLTLLASFWTGLVATSWLALIVQLLVYLIRDRERWVE